MSKSQKYYVVWQGFSPGVYSSWQDCNIQIKGFPGARYKAFFSLAEAQKAFAEGPSYDPVPNTPVKASSKSTNRHSSIIQNSICVDAACSGNPGPMEYQGVSTSGKQQLFHKQFDLGTNNIGEFLGIVHGLAMLQQQGKTIPIYTDSVNAMKWVREKKCKTKLVRNSKTEYLFQLIERAEKWLRENTYTNPVLKWDTNNWGEIPADFGRK